jgi:hypothetical protein
MVWLLLLHKTQEGCSQCCRAAARGQDLTALRASFNAEIEALDSKKLDAAVAEVHEDIVLFGVFSPFSIVGKEAFQQTVQEYFD